MKNLRCVQDDHTDRLMQHNLFGSGHDHDLRSNFIHDLLRSTYSSFDVSQEQKYEAGKMNAVTLLSQKLLHENPFRKNGYF